MEITTITIKVPQGSEQEITELVHNYVTNNYLPNRIKVVPIEKEQEYKNTVDAYLVANDKEVRFARVVKEDVLQDEEIVL